MRIALVVSGGVDRSGREHVIPALLWFIERIAQRCDLTVYVLRYLERPYSYDLLGARVCDLGRPRGLRRQYAALVDALRRDGPFDLLHAYWAVPSGVAASAAGRRLGIPSIVTLDSGEFVALPEIGYGLQLHWKQRLAVAATLRLATRLTVCTRFQERLARSRGAIPDVVPIGVDVRTFTPASCLEGPPWRLLHVANLNPVKDQAMLLNALRRLVERMPQVHLDIAGVDTLGGAIQDLARHLGVDRHVTFHGFQPTQALVALYQRAHLCLLTSRHEAAGVVALEAAACAVPTIGTAVGYLADWAPQRAVTSPADPEALAGAIADLLTDVAHRDHIAAAAREWTLRHDADWTAEQFFRLYQELQVK